MVRIVIPVRKVMLAIVTVVYYSHKDTGSDSKSSYEGLGVLGMGVESYSVYSA